MQKSGPSPEEGRNRHHVVPGGGTGTPGCSAGRACPGRAPWREMEQRRALRGMRGAGGAPKRLGQHSGGAMHGSVGRPPNWATPGFLRSWDESGGDRLRDDIGVGSRSPAWYEPHAPGRTLKETLKTGPAVTEERGHLVRVNCRARRREKAALERWEGSHSSPAV